jgi:hypothetical protein
MKKTITVVACALFTMSSVLTFAQTDAKAPAKKDEAKKEAPAKKDEAKKEAPAKKEAKKTETKKTETKKTETKSEKK